MSAVYNLIRFKNKNLAHNANVNDTKKQKAVKNMGRILPVCMLCKQIPEGGLAEGLCICGHFICSECERKIMEDNLHDVDGFHRLAAKIL